MLGEIISWIIIGVIAGAIAKWIRPGKQGGGFIATTLLGIAGALVGGFVFGLFGIKPENPNGFNFWSILVAVVGALIVLWLYFLIRKKKN